MASSSRGTPWSQRTTPEPSMAAFHVSNHELEGIKKRAQRLMGRFNALLVEYTDWFKAREQSFVDAVKSIQVMFPSLVPQHFSTIQHFRILHAMAEQQVSNRHPIAGGFDKLQTFLDFWYKFCMLKEELETTMMTEINDYIDSVTRMREPEKKTQIDELFEKLQREHSDTFNFRDIHNEKQNLFTYRLKMCDQNFLGLVGYIPYLTNMATKICFTITKLYLEKE